MRQSSLQDPGSDWYTLDTQNYKLHELCQHTGDIKSLDLHHSLTAIARWGGPMAATKDLQQINILKSEDICKDCVAFFSNNGKIISKVSYKDLDKIILFDFIDDELLLLLKADGKYYLMDPYKGTKKMYDLGESFRKDQILKAQICMNGFVVMRLVGGQVEFQYVPNAYEPQLTKMKSPEISVVPEHWILIPPLNSQYHKLEVHLTHPEAGIITLVEDEIKKVFYNSNFQESAIDQNLPHIPSIKMISMSPSYKFCSYLSYSPEKALLLKPRDNNPAVRNWVMTVLSSDFQLTTFTQLPLALENDKAKAGPIKDPSITERPSRLVWCADDCVVLLMGHFLMLVGPSGTEKIRLSNKNYSVFPEIDGLRVCTPKTNSILRRLPEAYVNVFMTLSVQPGAMLYAAYESFEKRNPIEDDDLRSKKDELAHAVNDCIQAGQFEIQQEFQIKLLKGASYGKTFLGSQIIDPDKLSEVCRVLRVQNALKRNGGLGGRALTYEQVIWLNSHQDQFIKLLLRYNLHYLAHEITKFSINIKIQKKRYLNFSLKLRSQIYTHWACCKVDTQEDDDRLCFVIKEKIKEEKGVSFTEIAHRAIEVGKSGLALKLLKNEPSLAKRVPVLLWMATYQEGVSNNYFEDALKDALQSRDSNLIYLVIMKFLKSEKLDESYTFGIMSQNLITQSHLMNYLRSFDQQGLQRYLQYQKRYDECAFLAIQQAYQQDKLPERIKLLEFAQKFFEEDQKDSFYGKQIQDQIENLNDLKNGKLKKSSKAPVEKPLNDILEAFLKEDDMKIAQEFAKFYKVPDRRYSPPPTLIKPFNLRFFLTRCKTLIQKKNFDELERLVLEKNKKQVLLPYEILADLLIKAGEEDKGLQMILKMQDPEESVNIFMKIGQMRYAAQAAMNAKKIPLLQEVRQAVQDPALLSFIDNYLSQSQKR